MTESVLPFISTVAGSLDSKGRVCIPAAYRQILATQNTGGVYVCPSFIDPALEAFGQSLLDDRSAKLATQDPFFSVDFDDEATALISRTQLLTPDEQGRVRLPDAMIAHAALKDRVVFVGKVQKFQIWDAERYAALEAESLARLRAKMARARASASSGETP